MDNAWRARGRARGRTQPDNRPPTSSTAGPSSAPPVRQQPAPYQQPRPTGSGGDGGGLGRSTAMAPGGGGSGVGGGAGGGGAPVSRGAMRGRRMLAMEIIHTRPAHMANKQGNNGNVIDLQANYFKLGTVTNWIVNQFRVDFAPEIDHVGLRKGLVKDHKNTLGGYMFDGSVLYCCHRFATDPLELFSTCKGETTPVQIKIRFVKQLMQGDAQYLQLFNIIMRKCLQALDLQLVGRNYYDARASVRIPQFNLELWPGYLTSIRQHEQQIMMCAEVTHKIMRMETVLDLYREVQQRCRPDELTHAFKSAALGLVVLTDYNNRTYRIDDIDYEVTPKATFAKKDGTLISYYEYYRTRYNLSIKNPDQPLLVSKSKARELRAGAQETVYLVPELCRMTGLTDRMRENFQLMRALAEHTRVGPGIRMQKLMHFNNRLQGVPEIMNDLKEWNLGLATNLVKFKGRVLNQESIVQGQRGKELKYPSGANVDWTASLRSNPMLAIADFRNWVVMVPNQLSRDAQSFIQMVMRAARGMGMMMSEPRVHPIPDDRQGTYVNQLEQVLSHYNPPIIVCCVTNNRADRYSAIKKKCCVDRAVPSQVITAKAMTNRGAMSIATKVAIQMNCKLGGAPWTVEIPVKGIMVVGFDVSHDTMNKSQSYGAMVASLNTNLSRYYSAVSANNSGEELSNDFSTNLLKALQSFRMCNDGALPSRIIIYRDGVGDGQLNSVLTHEVELIKRNLERIYQGPNYKMAFIVVSKRINTRLFHKEQNPPPGTVVDDCITLPERYDFFIVSQSVRQGSVSPTSYNVISDTSGLDADRMQRFTYKLTHLYYNWSGTVKVPAPVQYAHKLAMLVGQNLHRTPHGDLEMSLYFL